MECLITRILWPKNHLRSAALFWAGIFGCVWLCITYTSGMLTGWETAAVSAGGVVFTFGFIVLRELLRSVCCNVLSALLPGQMAAGVLIVLIFTLIDLCLSGAAAVSTPLDVCQMIVGVTLPVLAGSALLTALSLMGGALPAVLYAALTIVLPELLPVAPAPQRMISLLTDFALPLIFLVILDCDSEEPLQHKAAGKSSIGKKIRCGLIPFGIAVLSCFFLGMLPWRPAAIATGSMEPQLHVGDMVVVACDDTEPQVGDIIQFQRDGYTVIHRVAAISTENGETVYITKGDANNADDAGYVTTNDILGTVVGRIPAVGWLTLWLHGIPN